MGSRLDLQDEDRVNQIKAAIRDKGLDVDEDTLLVSFDTRYGMGVESGDQGYFLNKSGRLIVVTEGRLFA